MLNWKSIFVLVLLLFPIVFLILMAADLAPALVRQWQSGTDRYFAFGVLFSALFWCLVFIAILVRYFRKPPGNRE